MVRAIPDCSRCFLWAVIAAMLMNLLCHSGYCGQITEIEASELSKTSTRKVLGGNDDVFVSNHRDLDLERMFSSFFENTHVRAPFIFSNSIEGTESKGRTIITHASIPASPDFIVAISDSGTAFNIRLGIHSKSEMENLCLHYGINLKNKGAVRAFLRFYLAVNPGNHIPKMLESMEEVRAGARTRFAARVGDKAGELHFSEWWQRYSDDIEKLDFDIQISETKSNCFKATFYVLSNIDTAHLKKGPVVFMVSLKLTSKGSVNDLKFNPVWG